MTYDEWMSLSEEERDRRFKAFVEESDRLSRKIERETFFIREGLNELKEKVEEWKTWQKLHLN